MNNKGQVQAIIAFAVVVIILVLIAPYLVKIVVAPVSKTSQAFSTIDPTNVSSDAINYVQNKFTSMFDWVIAIFFIFNIVLLLITSFLIDVHPAFLLVYIIAVMFLVMFAPMVNDSLGKIYDNPLGDPNHPFAGSGENNIMQYVPITQFIYNNFGFILLGVIILSGLIMFGKYRLGSASQYGGRGY
jgi:hypothetical protein